jgi:hypothetical protein
MTPSTPLRRALVAPGNLIAGAGALALSALTWNPLPLVLYGLGEPVWLYNAAATKRYAAAIRDDHQRARLAIHEAQLEALAVATPCGRWMASGQLPDYPATYARLIAIRDQTAAIVEARDHAARALEQDIVVRMADMLRAYLLLVRERLLFHCALARVYPRLPEPAPRGGWLDGVARALRRRPARAPQPWTDPTAFVSLDHALAEVRAKAEGFRREVARQPEHAEVYAPIIETLDRRLGELAQRGRIDRDMCAQLKVFPDQFELILGKLGALRADVGEVAGEMKLLLEQTDDTVSFAEDLRATEASTLGRLSSLGHAA